MQTRVYLPVSVAELRALAADGILDARPARAAHAVTGMLAQAHPGWDEEDLEYLAFCDAVRSAGPGTAATPRVVLAADVEGDDVARAGPGPDLAAAQALDQVLSTVSVTQQVAVRQVVSVHLEDLDSPTPGPGEVPDFLWYDVTELDSVVEQLTA